MIQITPHMRVLVAVEPADFRKGIDGLARVCKEELKDNPYLCGAPRSHTAVRCLSSVIAEGRRSNCSSTMGRGIGSCRNAFQPGGFGFGSRALRQARCSRHMSFRCFCAVEIQRGRKLHHRGDR